MGRGDRACCYQLTTSVIDLPLWRLLCRLLSLISPKIYTISVECRFFVVPLTKKQLECVVMLSDGMQQTEVADALGVTPRTVQRWQLLPEFSQALKAAEAGQKASQVKVMAATHAARDTLNRREEMRSRELELLDNLQAFLLEDLQENKNHRSIDRLIKISERRSKLLGLDVRNYPILEALELLLSEQVATKHHAEIIMNNLSNLEEELRIIDISDD